MHNTYTDIDTSRNVLCVAAYAYMYLYVVSDSTILSSYKSRVHNVYFIVIACVCVFIL